MRHAVEVLALFLILPVVLRPQAAPGKCPAFAPVETVAKISPGDRIFRFDAGFVAVVNELRLDTDGSPIAYHPQNKGTTHLCNGLDPIVGGRRITDKGPGSPCFAAVRAAVQADWRRAESPAFCIYGFFAPGTSSPALKCNAWGGVFGKGEIPRQGKDDIAPGFFISTTSAHNPGRSGEGSQATYLDSDRTPYAVIPSALVKDKSLPRAGVAWAWNPRSNRTASAVFGDQQSKFGEISIAFAQKLEKGRIDPISPSSLAGESAIPWPYGKRFTGEVRLTGSPSGPVVLVYFSQPPTPAPTTYDPEAIQGAAETLLQKFGGPAGMESCLKPLLQ